MRVTFHIGAHGTGGGRLLDTLIDNRRALGRRGIRVPRPHLYRPLLRDLSTRLRGTAAEREEADAVMSTILKGGTARHVVLSSENFICVPDRVLDGGVLYERIFKAAWLRAMFPGAEVRFALALRDPARLVPTLIRDRPDMGGAIEPGGLSWADTVARLTTAVPGCPVIVWCAEETPLTFPLLLRSVSGAGPRLGLSGETAEAEAVMRSEGAEGLRAYLSANPTQNRVEWLKVVEGFLDRYADPLRLRSEVGLPHWTDAETQAVSNRYAADLARIRALPGVTLIRP